MSTNALKPTISTSNVGGILKNYPKGTTVYSPMFGYGQLQKVTDKIHVKFPKEHNVKIFRLDGKVSEDGEMMLFPSKESKVWDSFVKPYSAGDFIVVNTCDSKWISIFKDIKEGQIDSHIDYCADDGLIYGVNNTLCDLVDIISTRYATEEEKEELLTHLKQQAAKRWDFNTKRLVDLVLPEFKIGDTLRVKEEPNITFTITGMTEDAYIDKDNNRYHFKYQKQWELVPNKFDPLTLKPFQKVLVRTTNCDRWEGDFFSSYRPDATVNNKFHCVTNWWEKCIPFEGNEHLLGTTDNCDDYFVTWTED
jgi:hypothetical protein